MAEVVDSPKRQRTTGRMSGQDLNRFIETYGERISEDRAGESGYRAVLIKPADVFNEDDIVALYEIGLRNPTILPVTKEVTGYVPDGKIEALLGDPSVRGVVDTSARCELMDGSEEAALA